MTPHSRLSMLDENGWRKRIIPAAVHGHFRQWRNFVYSVLLFVFLATPWVTINGTQALLFDIPHMHFELLGALFLAHDSPFVFFIFAILGLTIMLATALWGRVWCGWACPQTVFIDSVYRRIEMLIEGNYLQQRSLYKSAMTPKKFFKYSLKWTLYLLFSSVFAHSFAAYFIGSKNLVSMMNGPPHDNWVYFVIISSFTVLLLFNFGWFREQFCIIMCPYGKFQSVLLDQHSLNVTYNGSRGEPRKAPHDDPLKRGDCISCNRCVEVCPTGIDIRNGIQLECIACTACIDACDEIMTKVKKPLGLVSYNSLEKQNQIFYLRPRVLIYMILLVACTSAFAVRIANRKTFTALLVRATDAPFQVTEDHHITNHFKINLHNQSHQVQNFTISLGDDIDSNLVNFVQSSESHSLEPGDSQEVHLFVRFDSSLFTKAEKIEFKVRVEETLGHNITQLPAVGVGPTPTPSN